jgi:hypothetical protein
VPQRVHVRGLDDFRRDLNAMNGGWDKELAVVHRTLAKDVSAEGRAFARGHGGSTAHFAGSIYGIGSAKKAAITNKSVANAAIWGAKKRTGWNARRRNLGGAPQHPKWVGSGWDVGGAGGPRGINDAIRHDKEQIFERYLEMVDDLSKRAFPRGGLRG